jgi:hypothetical protein
MCCKFTLYPVISSINFVTFQSGSSKRCRIFAGKDVLSVVPVNDRIGNFLSFLSFLLLFCNAAEQIEAEPIT